MSKMSLSSPPPAQQEKPDDPGLVIFYDVMAVHTALGQPNAPVGQGADVGESLQAFKDHIKNQLLLVPLDKEKHCVLKGVEMRGRSRETTYRQDAFHHLDYMLFEKMVDKLRHISTGMHPWSIRVSGATSDPTNLPPNQPLAAIYKIAGGRA